MSVRYAKYRESFIDGVHEYHFTTVPCPHCKGKTTISVKGPDLFAYNNGAFIQDAFPYLTNGQRERLITGYCEPCWEVLFRDEDDEVERLEAEDDDYWGQQHGTFA